MCTCTYARASCEWFWFSFSLAKKAKQTENRSNHSWCLSVFSALPGGDTWYKWRHRWLYWWWAWCWTRWFYYWCKLCRHKRQILEIFAIVSYTRLFGRFYISGFVKNNVENKKLNPVIFGTTRWKESVNTPAGTIAKPINIRWSKIKQGWIPGLSKNRSLWKPLRNGNKPIYKQRQLP